MPNTLPRVVGSPTMQSPLAMRVGNRAIVSGAFHAGLGVQPGAGSETIVPSSRGGSSTTARYKRGHFRAGTAGAEPFARVSTSFMRSSHDSSSTTRGSACTGLLARQRAKASSGRLVPRPRRRLMPPEYCAPRSRRPKTNKMCSRPRAPSSGARDVLPICVAGRCDRVNVRGVVLCAFAVWSLVGRGVVGEEFEDWVEDGEVSSVLPGGSFGGDAGADFEAGDVAASEEQEADAAGVVDECAFEAGDAAVGLDSHGVDSSGDSGVLAVLDVGDGGAVGGQGRFAGVRDSGCRWLAVGV